MALNWLFVALLVDRFSEYLCSGSLSPSGNHYSISGYNAVLPNSNLLFTENNRTVGLTCKWKANSSSEGLSWRKLGSTFEWGPSLDIFINSETYSGKYECGKIAYRPTIPEHSSTNVVQIIVKSPYVQMDGPDSIKELDETLLFNCQAFFKNPPNPIWYHNGKRLRPNRRMLMVNDTLQIMNATFEDAGVYVCEYQLAYSELNLSRYGFWAVGSPPVITQLTGQTFNLGAKSAYITCKAAGFPTPAVQWSKDGTPISIFNTENIQFQSNQGVEDAALIFRDISRSQLGVYTCSTLNHYGMVSADHELRMDFPSNPNKANPILPTVWLIIFLVFYSCWSQTQ